MKGGSQNTASATCAGGINRTTRAAMSRNFAARRKLILLEATGQHSREEFSLEKAADYSISCDALSKRERVRVCAFESTKPGLIRQQLKGVSPIAGARFGMASGSGRSRCRLQTRSQSERPVLDSRLERVRNARVGGSVVGYVAPAGSSCNHSHRHDGSCDVYDVFCGHRLPPGSRIRQMCQRPPAPKV